MLRILHLLSQTELTGSEIYAQTLAQEQHQKGHLLFFVSDDFHVPFPGETRALSVSNSGLWQRWKNAQTLKQWLKEWKIDVIHCHSRAACRIAAWAKLRHIPVITTLHGEQHFSWSKRLNDIYGDTVLVVAEPIRQQLIYKFRMSPSKIHLLRNPLAWPLDFTSRPLPAGGKIRVLLAGRDSGPKGERLRSIIKEGIPAWSLRFPEVEFQILATQGLKKDFGGPRIFSWVDAPQGLEEAIKNVDLVIGGGRIALEALSLGRECLVFGEKAVLGRATSENWSQCLVSNFGDMGDFEKFDIDKLSSGLEAAIGALKASERNGLLENHFTQFESKNISERVEEFYRGARLGIKAPSLPILMYHKVVKKDSSAKHRIFVTPERLRLHLKTLKRLGFTPISLKELNQFWWGRRPIEEFPRKPILLSFDDGYRSVLERGAPIFKELSFTADIFVLSDRSISRNSWDEPDDAEAPSESELMNSEELRQLQSFGFCIQSHGINHLSLPKLSDQEVLHQLRESKTQLEREFNTEVVAFAYPFGEIDSRLPTLAKTAGYGFAVNTDRGGLRWFDEPHSLFRVNIFPEDGAFDLWRKTLPWYRKRYYQRRGQ